MLGAHYVPQVLEHWKEFHPTLYRELKAQGPHSLRIAAQKVVNQAGEQVANLMPAGMSEHQAEELVLREVICLPPEPGCDPNPEV